MPERLAAARTAWCEEEGDRLTAVMKDAFAALENRIGDRVAAILSPFVADALRRRALDEMKERLSALLAKSARGVLEVSGNEDLVAELRQRIGDANGVTFRAEPAMDVRVTCDDTVIETQLAAWAEVLAPQSESTEGGPVGRQGQS